MGIKLKALIIASAVTALTALGWYVYALQNQLESAEESEARLADRLEQSEQFRELERAQQSAVAVIDQIQTDKLRKAQDEINDLRRRVLSGAVELRVSGTCPDTGVSEAAGGSRVGDGARPRLTERATEGYLQLREGIERVTRQLTACQDILGELKKSPD